jgi:hypothetical protein
VGGAGSLRTEHHRSSCILFYFTTHRVCLLAEENIPLPNSGPLAYTVLHCFCPILRPLHGRRLVYLHTLFHTMLALFFHGSTCTHSSMLFMSPSHSGLIHDWPAYTLCPTLLLSCSFYHHTTVHHNHN